MTRVANLENLPKDLGKERICAVVDAICPFTEDDRETLLNVLRHAKHTNRIFYRFYCDNGGPLASRMLSRKDTDWQKIVNWEYGIIKIAKEQGMEAGLHADFLGVFGMVEAFWPECQDALILSLRARRDTEFATLDTCWTTEF